MGLQVPQNLHKKHFPSRHLLLPMLMMFLPGTCNLLAHSAVTVSMKTKGRTMLKSVIIGKNLSLLLLCRVSLKERILYGRNIYLLFIDLISNMLLCSVCKTDHVFVIIWEFDLTFICQLQVCGCVCVFFPVVLWVLQRAVDFRHPQTFYNTAKDRSTLKKDFLDCSHNFCSWVALSSESVRNFTVVRKPDCVGSLKNSSDVRRF